MFGEMPGDDAFDDDVAGGGHRFSWKSLETQRDNLRASSKLKRPGMPI
jgi:hypothetical protein